MFFYFLYKIGYFISNILPIRGAYWLAEKITDMRYFFVKKDREAVAENLKIVLKKDIGECRIMARKVFRSFGLYMVDFFRMARLDGNMLKEMVHVEGIENLDNVLKQGRGVIVLSCHLGNWEMGAVILAMMGYDISVVALNHRYKKINDFFIRQRQDKGVKVITVSSVMKRCVSTLLNKKILALVGDRDFTSSGITLDFFGMPTSIPKGLAVLGSMTNSLIVPIFLVREDRFRHKLIIDRPIEPELMPDERKDEAIENTTKKFIPIMEKYIRSYPEQWLVFRPFWEKLGNALVL